MWLILDMFADGGQRRRDAARMASQQRIATGEQLQREALQLLQELAAPDDGLPGDASGADSLIAERGAAATTGLSRLERATTRCNAP